MRLGRDLDALTGAGLLIEVAATDREFTPVMLRLIVRHAEFAAQRAARLLRTEFAVPTDRDGVDGGES